MKKTVLNSANENMEGKKGFLKLEVCIITKESNFQDLSETIMIQARIVLHFPHIASNSHETPFFRC